MSLHSFRAQSLATGSAFPDFFLSVACANRERDAGVIISHKQTASDPTITNVTWGALLCDVYQCTEQLVRSSGRGSRALGEEVTVGLLMRSGYAYFVVLMATTMLRWTVRSRFILPWCALNVSIAASSYVYTQFV